jgi:DNA-binding GntR family transcriptional regulator
MTLEGRIRSVLLLKPRDNDYEAQGPLVTDPPTPRLEPVAAPKVRDLVYARLKQGILTHQFVPGSQLVARELAAQLHTSTTPVVQVILQLAREGLVEVIPRRGTFVADLSADRIRELFEAAEVR